MNGLKKEEKLVMIKDLIKILGLEDVPNIVGFSLEVKHNAPTTINVSILAGKDGIANFIRTFPKKYELTEIEPEKSGLNKLLQENKI